MNQNGSGIDFPTIELGGQHYIVKFSRASLYRMEKLGIKFEVKVTPLPDQPGMVNRSMTFAQVVDMLLVAIGFKGTAEELAELVTPAKVQEGFEKIMDAWGKAFPSPQPIKLQEPAGQPEAPPPAN